MNYMAAEELLSVNVGAILSRHSTLTSDQNRVQNLRSIESIIILDIGRIMCAGQLQVSNKDEREFVSRVLEDVEDVLYVVVGFI